MAHSYIIGYTSSVVELLQATSKQQEAKCFAVRGRLRLRRPALLFRLLRDEASVFSRGCCLKNTEGDRRRRSNGSSWRCTVLRTVGFIYSSASLFLTLECRIKSAIQEAFNRIVGGVGVNNPRTFINFSMGISDIPQR